MRRALPLALLLACSSNETTVASPAPDGGTTPVDPDSGTSTPPKDAATDTGETTEPDAGPGETCVGYGAGDTCAAETGKFGYVCFNGPPPGVAGCKLKQSSSLGNSYCCTENVCVEQIDQGSACNGVSGKPHRFQCPPTASGNATPAAGCEEHNSGSTEVEKYYCCP
jgi:hypothetical protein